MSLLAPSSTPFGKSLLVVAMTWIMACANGQPSTLDAAPSVIDASSADADDLPCTPAEGDTFYADLDGDGFGTPDLTAVDCAQPEGYVNNDLDCDDADSRSNPNSAELCDGLDNDCNDATPDVCLNDCSPQLRGEDTYLFCAQGLSYSAAKTACVTEGMQLVRIDDDDEQNWTSAQRNIAFGGLPTIWMGANDATSEGIWVWHDNVQFWQGAGGGTPVDGLYSKWHRGEPNDSRGEDCATIDDDANGAWNDDKCVKLYSFVCERYNEAIE